MACKRWNTSCIRPYPNSDREGKQKGGARRGFAVESPDDVIKRAHKNKGDAVDIHLEVW